MSALSKTNSMRTLPAVACLLSLLLARSSFARTAELPPLSISAVDGHWEGFCEAPPWYTFAVQMDITSGGQGDVTVGVWFGGNTRVLQDTLPVERLIVTKGALALTAGKGRRGTWKSLRLQGRGKAISEAGWIQARLKLPGTAYACDVTLFKESPGYGTTYFGGIAELIRELKRAADEKGVQQGVEPDGRSPAAPARRLTP